MLWTHVGHAQVRDYFVSLKLGCHGYLFLNIYLMMVVFYTCNTKIIHVHPLFDLKYNPSFDRNIGFIR